MKKMRTFGTVYLRFYDIYIKNYKNKSCREFDGKYFLFLAIFHRMHRLRVIANKPKMWIHLLPLGVGYSWWISGDI